MFGQQRADSYIIFDVCTEYITGVIRNIECSVLYLGSVRAGQIVARPRKALCLCICQLIWYTGAVRVYPRDVRTGVKLQRYDLVVTADGDYKSCQSW